MAKRIKSPLIELETLFKALADRTRLRMLGLLSGGEVCVCHMYEALGIPQPKASRHLAYLRRAGIVEGERRGLWVYYRLAEPGSPVLKALLDGVRHSLGHVPSTSADIERLERQTGAVVPKEQLAAAPILSCCATDPCCGE